MAHQSLALKDFNYVVVLGIRYSSPTALLANADLEIEILQQPTRTSASSSTTTSRRRHCIDILRISSFIMRKLIEKETCPSCYTIQYTFLTKCKQRVSCQLKDFKQLGGLM